jgi:hypothetical protein
MPGVQKTFQLARWGNFEEKFLSNEEKKTFHSKATKKQL